MKSTRIYSRAKINLSLDVLSKRPDNYHEVCMIMQTVKLADVIDIEITNTGEIELKTNLPYLPTGPKNIAYKAVELFFDYTNIKMTGISINIFKKIPVAAGLAGGSTNAAGVLLGLNKLYNTKMSRKELMKISKVLGADVPYCIHGGTMLAEGIGEKLSYLPPIKRVKAVLCKPNFSVSTAKVYESLSFTEQMKHPDTPALIKSIKARDYKTLTTGMYNVLEDVTAKEYPQIDEIKAVLLECNADGVLMSGSGPTVFGLFESEENAIKARQILKRTYKDTYITDISTNVNNPY